MNDPFVHQLVAKIQSTLEDVKVRQYIVDCSSIVWAIETAAFYTALQMEHNPLYIALS